MGRRDRRGQRPELETFERRELLSAITAALAANSAVLTGHHARAVADIAGGGSGSGGAGTGGGQGSSNPGGTGGANSPSPSYGASVSLGQATLTQGPLLNPDGSINNMAIAPTGTPGRHQARLQRFTARFVGPYSVVPGRTTTQAAQILIQGGGSASTMLHSDVQLRIVQPKDSTLPFGGAGTIFDRNINSNSALGLDISTPQGSVDRGGRPNHFRSVSVDVNISSGTYVESYGQGTLSIHYIPSGRHSPGVLGQGTAITTLRMNLYAPDISYLLRNLSYNP